MSKAKKNKKRRNGYLQKYKYNVTWGDYGVPGECITWCKKKCRGNWGWWFETHDEWHTNWNPEYNIAYMSFSHRRDAVRFWFENLKILEGHKDN